MATRFVLPVADVGYITPHDGAKLFFYANLTLNPLDTFSDNDLTTPNTNPVIADENGLFPDIFIAETYTVILQDKNGEQKGKWDYVSGFIETPSQQLQFLESTSIAQENIDAEVGEYTWGGGTIASSATEFNIGISRASVFSTAEDYNPYFNDTPLAVPGNDSYSTNDHLFNFGYNVTVIRYHTTEINSDHLLFGLPTVRMHGYEDQSPPYNNDYVGIQNPAAPNEFDINTNEDDFTFKIWMFLETLPGATEAEGIQIYHDGTPDDENLNFAIAFTESNLYVATGDGANIIDFVETPHNLSTGEWNFWEVGRKNGLLYLFKDGDLLSGGTALTSSGTYIIGNEKHLGAVRFDSGWVQRVLDGSFAYAEFIKGTCLHTESYTPPDSASVFNNNGGAFALRIITDDGELTSAVYSGYGDNLTQNDWASPFSSSIGGNTYIGLCGELESEVEYFTGNVEIDKGVNDGEGIYTYKVTVHGYSENPLYNGKKQVSATGYFQTEFTPIGFKLYCGDDTTFNGGIADLSQYARTGILTASPVSVGLPEYGNMGTWYENTGTANDLTFIIPADAENRDEYPPLVDGAYMDGTGIDFFATASNDGDMTGKLGDGPVVPIQTPELAEIASGAVVSGRPYSLRYSAANEVLVLNDLFIPDDFIEMDMIQDEAVTEDKIADDAVTTDKINDDAVTTDKINDDAVTEDKLAPALVSRLPFAWCCFDGTTTGSHSPSAGNNITTVTRVSAGKYTITFTVAAGTTNYAILATCVSGDKAIGTDTIASGTFNVWVRDDSADTYQDSAWVSVLVYK